MNAPGALCYHRRIGVRRWEIRGTDDAPGRVAHVILGCADCDEGSETVVTLADFRRLRASGEIVIHAKP